MKKVLPVLLLLALHLPVFAQDTLVSEAFDPNEYADASNTRNYCTQKVLNQMPTKQFSLGYEVNAPFQNANLGGTQRIFPLGGLRASANFLAISTNRLILSVGASYWGVRAHTNRLSTLTAFNQLYTNRMDLTGLNALAFKPLNEKHFLIVQANADLSHIGRSNNFGFSREALTFYGSALFGWKKNDYRMLGIGLSRSYRLGRPILVPVLLYNKTFNDHWGIEALLPARGHVRYNFSTNSLLAAGFELEGQQYHLQGSSLFLQRGEIKPRIVFEKKLIGFFWLSAQLGYRINGRFNLVNRYDGTEANEVWLNNWGNSPYVNISINLVTP